MDKKKSLLLLALIVTCAIGVSGYIWYSRTTSVFIKEPLEISYAPPFITLYAGENQTFSFNITNKAKANYTITLTFTLNDTHYQQAYVTFSNTSYLITHGENIIFAWIKVDASAPPTSKLQLTIDFNRTSPFLNS